jgi:hypothetical protein
MAETLGSLCDKLTIVKLKEWHSEQQPERMRSLAAQEKQLCEEIDAFIADAASGRIPVERLTFASNKVYRREGNVVAEVTGSIGAIFSHLAEVNCTLWHEVDKGYEIEKVPPEGKDSLIKQLAMLNLERNQCIDQIDRQLHAAVERMQPNTFQD